MLWVLIVVQWLHVLGGIVVSVAVAGNGGALIGPTAEKMADASDESQVAALFRRITG